MPTWKPPTAPTMPVRQAIAEWLRTHLDDSVVSDQSAPARVKRAIMKVPATAVNKLLPMAGWTETPEDLGVADIPAPGTIMIGSRSPMFNRDAAKGFAEALRKISVAERQHPSVVQNLWERFRTFVGPDNRLRQEISDEGLRVDTGFPNEYERFKNLYPSPIWVEHQALSDAYPNTRVGYHVEPGLMQQLTFRNSHLTEDKFGDAFYRRSFSDNSRNPVGEIVLTRPNLSFEELKKLKTMPPDAINQANRANIAHELQHAVQALEGFSPGSSPDRFSTLPRHEQKAFKDMLTAELQALLPTPIGKATHYGLGDEFYRRAPGEVEARLVERRLLDPSPDIAPPLQYDVPLSKMYRRRR